MHDIPGPNNIPFQNVPEGASSIGYVEKLILFLEKYLPGFTKERNVSGSQSENDLTELLFRHLTRKARFNSENIEYHYIFQTEKSQKQKKQKGHPRRMDMAARLNTVDINMEVIYCIEAKKLPTPGSGREKEYVLGKGGAIERFKNEEHGLDDEGSLIRNNGIVAYITKHDFDHWHHQINQWISDAGWQDSEKLVINYFSAICKLSSMHQRISGDALYLTHFWIPV